MFGFFGHRYFLILGSSNLYSEERKNCDFCAVSLRLLGQSSFSSFNQSSASFWGMGMRGCVYCSVESGRIFKQFWFWQKIKWLCVSSKQQPVLSSTKFMWFIIGCGDNYWEHGWISSYFPGFSRKYFSNDLTNDTHRHTGMQIIISHH